MSTFKGKCTFRNKKNCLAHTGCDWRNGARRIVGLLILDRKWNTIKNDNFGSSNDQEGYCWAVLLKKGSERFPEPTEEICSWGNRDWIFGSVFRNCRRKQLFLYIIFHHRHIQNTQQATSHIFNYFITASCNGTEVTLEQCAVRCSTGHMTGSRGPLLARDWLGTPKAHLVADWSLEECLWLQVFFHSR